MKEGNKEIEKTINTALLETKILEVGDGLAITRVNK